MDFEHLKYVIEIVETGSISRAAANLFISQPNLSTQINELENRLGKKIFERTNKGVILTTFGVEVYHHAKSIVSQFQIIEGILTKNSNENKIKIATVGCEVINSEFLELCKRFNASNYEFELYQCSAEESIRKLINRDVDLAIILYSQFQYIKLDRFLASERLEMKDLFKGEMKAHISSKWPISSKSSVSEEELNRLLHVKKANLFMGMFSFDYELNNLGISKDIKAIITHENKIYQEALEMLPSFGITVDWNCPKEMNSHLKRIPINDKQIVIKCAAIKRQNELLKEELTYLLDRLKLYDN